MDLVSLLNALWGSPVLIAVAVEISRGHRYLSKQASRQISPTALDPHQEAARSVTGIVYDLFLTLFSLTCLVADMAPQQVYQAGLSCGVSAGLLRRDKKDPPG